MHKWALSVTIVNPVISLKLYWVISVACMMYETEPWDVSDYILSHRWKGPIQS